MVTEIENIRVEVRLPNNVRTMGVASVSKELDTGRVTISVEMFDTIGTELEKLVQSFEIKREARNGSR